MGILFRKRIKPLCDNDCCCAFKWKVYAFFFCWVIPTAFGNVLKSTPTRDANNNKTVKYNSALKALLSYQHIVDNLCISTSLTLCTYKTSYWWKINLNIYQSNPILYLYSQTILDYRLWRKRTIKGTGYWITIPRFKSVTEISRQLHHSRQWVYKMDIPSR